MIFPRNALFLFLCISSTADAGLRKRDTNSSSPKRNVHLGVANLHHPHDVRIDIGGQAGGLQTRIIGGDYSDENEFPYFVDIGGCGGALIAERVVVSAAHCEQEGRYMIGQDARVGAFNRAWYSDDGSFRVKISKQENHPAYSTVSLENDLMLLLLDDPVQIGSGTKLLLPDEDDEIAPDTAMTVIGMGKTESGYVSDRLRDVEVLAKSNSECVDAYGPGPSGVTVESMFCAGVDAGGKDSCQGDSGGPIVTRQGNEHTIQGVVSWGIGCAEADYPGVYARVSSARAWIEDTVCNNWQQDADFCSKGNNPGGNPTDAPNPSPTPNPTVAPTTNPTVNPTANPTANPTDAPAANPTDAPTANPMTTCGSGEIFVQFSLTTDSYAAESFWQIFDAATGDIAMNGGLYDAADETYVSSKCVPDKCHILTLYDSWGDGLRSDGAYSVQVNGVETAAGSFPGRWKNHQINCNFS